MSARGRRETASPLGRSGRGRTCTRRRTSRRAGVQGVMTMWSPLPPIPRYGAVMLPVEDRRTLKVSAVSAEFSKSVLHAIGDLLGILVFPRA